MGRPGSANEQLPLSSLCQRQAPPQALGHKGHDGVRQRQQGPECVHQYLRQAMHRFMQNYILNLIAGASRRLTSSDVYLQKCRDTSNVRRHFEAMRQQTH